VAAVELLAHRLMFLVSALPRSRWAPHYGLRRCAAAPGLALLIKLMLVATRYKTLYWWLHGGYMVKNATPKQKSLLAIK
jgi:hypothetical protein